jgi:hypothetical protein
VDTKDLKELARKHFPETSQLRKLILGESDNTSFSEWLVKVNVYTRPLEDDIEGEIVLRFRGPDAK